MNKTENYHHYWYRQFVSVTKKTLENFSDYCPTFRIQDISLSPTSLGKNESVVGLYVEKTTTRKMTKIAAHNFQLFIVSGLRELSPLTPEKGSL
ncbi:CLUMA_CG005632, isoform A [Clunio marinus]|uniref:CLUMA_CG005632, isoform A n=1 Tax=Clunio marinus TaxID=568069 RepID=A0A1J1HXI3_9DIPT|nr:CLUMA_CG005632, isoform A [Clunio marinus]